VLSPYGYALASVAGVAEKLPNPKMPIEGSIEIIAIPFGPLSDGNRTISNPTFGYNLRAKSGPATLDIAVNVSTDIAKLMAKDTSGVPKGSATFNMAMDNAQMRRDLSAKVTSRLGNKTGDVVEKLVQEAMNTFTFENARVEFGMTETTRALATIKFSVFKKAYAPKVAAEFAANPIEAVADEIKKLIETQIPLCTKLSSDCVIYDALKPKPCPAGTETQGAFCYAPCDKGLYATATGRCSPYCPSGWTDTGPSCGRPSYTRDGFGSEKNCEEVAGNNNCETQSSRWVKKCSAGYNSTAVPIRGCIKPCPEGMTTVGLLCDKPKGYDRKNVPK
jgi:hypothetical protein